MSALSQSFERGILIGAFILFLSVFIYFAPGYPLSKQRAWILTAVGSSTMSLASLPFVYDVLKGGSLAAVVQRPWLSDSACRFFQSYLASDLFLGFFYYRDRINLLTGWVHHVAYITLMEYVIHWEWSHLFVMAAVMELPTFILSISYLVPRTRHDIFFAAVFFATRIVFHISIIMQLLFPSVRGAVSDSSYWAPALFTLALPMHVHWFMGCVRGIIKRSNMTPLSTSTTSPTKISATPSSVDAVNEPAAEATAIKVPGVAVVTSVWTKAYPPSIQSLPTRTSNGHRFRKPLAEVHFEPVFDRPDETEPSELNPPRRSLMEVGTEEAVKRFVGLMYLALESRPVRVPALAVRKAIEMGRGVRDIYRELRGYGSDAGDGLMKASQEVWAF